MKNLTARKIVLGLLMTLVLAFGVQRVAEAITRPSGQTEAHLNTVDSTIQDVGTTASIPAITITPDRANSRETVSITKSSGVTLTGSFYRLSSVRLTEVDDDLTDDINGTSFTYTRDGLTQTIAGATTGAIDITFTTKGRQWVKISATDYDDPNDANDFSGSWSTTYTYYVKGPGTSTTTISLLGLSNGYKTGIFANDAHRLPIHNGDSGHYDVTYTIVPDTGQVQIETTEGALGALTTGTTGKNTSSAFDVHLQTNATYQVTAKVTGSDPGVETVGVYIIGTPTLTVGHPGDPDGDGTVDDATTGSKGDGGLINQVLPKAFSAVVTDEAVTPANVPGVVVRFQVRGSGDAAGYLVFDATSDTPADNNAGILVTSNNRRMLNANNQNLTMATGKTLYVRTNASGRADVDFQLGTNRKQDVTVSAVRQTKTVSAYSGTAVSGNQLVTPRSQNSQAPGRSGEYELRVKAEDEDGEALPNAYVEFRTSDGTLDDPSDATVPTTAGRLGVMTDTRGEAFIFFDPKDGSGSPRVTAHLLEAGTDTNFGTADDVVIDDVVFNIGGPAQRDDQGSPPPTNRLAISPTSITGDPGDTETITVTALDTANVAVTGVPVTLSLPSAFTTAGGSATSTSGTTPFTSTLTLPNTAGTHIITATAGGYSSASTTVTVTAPTGPGILTLTLGARNGNQQTVTVRATRGGSPQNGVRFTITGGLISYSGVTGTTGSATLIITLPTATNSHTLTASAAEYTTTQATAGAPGQTTDTSPPTTGGSVGEADSIEIDGQRQRSGTVNRNTPLRVRVLDANDNGVSNVRVTFRILAPGQGRLSQRGNGRATQDTTDTRGYASASLTPLGDGDIIVRATAAGVSAPVTFIIAVGEADDTATDTQPREPDVTASREISPVVHVGAAQRPPMLWVDGGKIYALVGANVKEEFVQGVDNALNIAVGGGKVYWTEKTGESGGTINSANRDGSNVQELASIFATPMGIAVDVTNSKLYWTNSRGRIQSANLDGSGIANVLQNQEGAMDIALSGGNAYWTQGGNVRFVNLRGQKQIRNISTGTDTAGSLAIGGGKVYWTEMTGTNAGTINSANLNGTGETQLASIKAVPMGIAIDGSRSKLYWTNSRGRVQRANLDGSKIQNVVDGLGSPGDMVLSNSIAAPTKTPTTDSGQTASRSKYDVNGDGAVDNMDVAEVVKELGGTDHRYDFNGDGAVNVVDLVLISKEVDEGAAGAPTVFGMQLSAAQIDVLKEQIDLLIATGDRSPAAMRTLIYLQQLIATARPEKTQLLANYPNPFNPETWIPYELATDTTVKITIYNTQGVVIRTLELGHQSAGYYTDRDRAAYWDGRNAFGEQVASGIYFYRFETDAMSSMRKMVILK